MARRWRRGVHLSRFHFDRLVSAAAGEPPAALRRRVLLERAAYRLVTTDHDVLRVAVEAGYASNEAFTRAFRRAFGRAPSRWRAPADERSGCRRPSQRALPPTRGPARPRPPEGDRDGPAHPDGRAPRLAGRRARGPVRAADAGAARRARSRSRSTASTTTRPCGRCWPASSARWRCGTPPPHDRPYDIDDERAGTPRRHPRQAGRGRAGVPRPGARDRRRGPAGRDVRRRPLRAAARSSRTAGWSPTC